MGDAVACKARGAARSPSQRAADEPRRRSVTGVVARRSHMTIWLVGLTDDAIPAPQTAREIVGLANHHPVAPFDDEHRIGGRPVPVVDRALDDPQVIAPPDHP